MGGAFLDRRVDQAVQLHDRAGGAVLDGKLERVRLLVPDGGERQIIMVIWFDYWTYKRIDRGHLFGYTFDSLDLADGQLFELDSRRPVQLELELMGEARTALAAADGEALLDQAQAALTGADPASPLVDVASYRYLAIYQEQTVDGVTFLRGATSVYRKSA